MLDTSVEDNSGMETKHFESLKSACNETKMKFESVDSQIMVKKKQTCARQCEKKSWERYLPAKSSSELT